MRDYWRDSRRHRFERTRAAPRANRQPPDLRLPVRAGRGAVALFRFGKMNNTFQRKGAKAQRPEEVCFSLTPGFSQVLSACGMGKPFQRFLRTCRKPLKRFLWRSTESTSLEWGVNEMTSATYLIH